MIYIPVRTLLVIFQVVITCLSIYSLPSLTYAEKVGRSMKWGRVLVAYAPTIWLIWVEETGEFMIGFALLTVPIICWKTTNKIINFINSAMLMLSQSSPALFAVLEAISMTISASFLRAATFKEFYRAHRSITNLYLLNSIMYVVLITSLVHVSYTEPAPLQNLGPNSFLICISLYLLVKFGTLAVASLKKPLYELLPMESLPALTALMISLVPVMLSVYTMLEQGPLPIPIVVIALNTLSLGRMMDTRTMRSLMLYTTVMSNLLVLVMYLL